MRHTLLKFSAPLTKTLAALVAILGSHDCPSPGELAAWKPFEHTGEFLEKRSVQPPTSLRITATFCVMPRGWRAANRRGENRKCRWK